MEGTSILTLENFSLISIIMPYYGFTHKMFLVLSVISKGTRQMLIENYKVFRRIMLKHSLKKEKISYYDLANLSLPWDLFRFQIDNSSSDNEVENLIKFINTNI